MSSDHDQHHHAHGHGHIEFRFCPRCGGALEQRRVKTNEPKRLVCQACSFIFYQDPKVVAGTVFTLDGGIVLLKRGVEPALGKWVFPGGYVGGELAAADESLEARVFAPKEIPWHDLAFDSTKDALNDYISLYLKP